MRMFDFECGDCSAVYEKLLKSDTIPECKVCGSAENQKKLFSAPRIAYAKSNDQPRTQEDLANYVGDNQYFKGYKPSWVR